LTNGIIVGAGVAVFIAALFGAFALNALYVSLSSYLSSNGVSIIGIQVQLEDIITLLSLCPLGFVFGPCCITLGLLNQFSARTRFAYKKKDLVTRISSGLMTGGAIGAALFGGDFFRQFYEPAFPWYEPFELGLVIGIIMLVAGISLLLVRKPK